MQGSYEDVEHKIWLAIQSAKGAKALSVHEYGIGEELPYVLIGWVDDQVVMVCQPRHQRASRSDRLGAIHKAAFVLRRAWGCTSFTFIAESFGVLNKGSLVPDVALAQQFADGNKDVVECLTFVHVEPDDMDIVMIPYKYGLSRTVSFGAAKLYPKTDDGGLEFPKLLMDALNLDPVDPPEDVDEYFFSIVEGLREFGIDCIEW